MDSVLRQLATISGPMVSVPVRSYATSHNIQSREPRVIPVRLSPAPAPPKRLLSRRITTATESGESFAYRITDLQAAVAVELHPLGLGLGEQGIRHESVTVEDGVVDPSFHSLSMGAASTGERA